MKNKYVVTFFVRDSDRYVKCKKSYYNKVIACNLRDTLVSMLNNNSYHKFLDSIGFSSDAYLISVDKNILIINEET